MDRGWRWREIQLDVFWRWTAVLGVATLAALRRMHVS